jgi:hypothetical protein
MTSSDGIHESGHRRQTEIIAAPASLWLSRRRRVALGAIRLIIVSAAVALAGCGLSDGIGTLVVDPGRYDAYHCKELTARLKVLRAREKELRGLMDKASEGGGGVVIGTMAYRTDYETVLSEEKLLQRTAAEKKCDVAASAYQSDQSLH